MDYKEAFVEFKRLIDSYKRVTIVSHKRADGDTISSALALYSYLNSISVKSELVCIDSDLPQEFSFLYGFDRFKNKISYSDSLVVTLDCATLGRCGFDLENRDIINIDHHQDNSLFGNLNIVNVDVSTTIVLYKLLRVYSNISKDCAVAIYSGLLSDSKNFTSTLTTKNTLLIASELLELGVDLNLVANRVNRSKALSHIRVKAKAIDSLELFNNGRVAVMSLTKDILKETGALNSSITGLVDEALSLVTVEIATLIVESDNFLKISIRSKNINISKIAQKFGGGGHKNAAGFEVNNDTIENFKNILLKELYKGL